MKRTCSPSSSRWRVISCSPVRSSLPEREVEPAVGAGDGDAPLVVDRAGAAVRRAVVSWGHVRPSGSRLPAATLAAALEDLQEVGRLLVLVVLDELEPEAALDAEVAARDRVVERRGDLDDLVVLLVQLEVAPDAAVRADGGRLGLLALVPAAVLAAVVLALEHQRAGRADGDAVAAVDARGVGERVGELGGDAGVEPAPGDGDGERVLPVGAAALDALVTEDALRVVAHVELVVDLRRLVHGGGVAARRGSRGGPRARGRARRPRTAAPAGRSARDRPRTPRSSGRRWASPTGRPTRRGTRAPSCGCGSRAPNASGSPCRPRPCARTTAPGRGRPRSRRRTPGRR